MEDQYKYILYLTENKLFDIIFLHATTRLFSVHKV